MAIIDKVGRKPMLLVGSVVMWICMVIVGILVAKFSYDWSQHSAAGWVAVALIWCYVGAFGATWGPASWTIISEIFPLSIRAKEHLSALRATGYGLPLSTPCPLFFRKAPFWECFELNPNPMIHYPCVAALQEDSANNSLCS